MSAILYVKKHPSPTAHYVAFASPQAGDGWEQMTDEALKAWSDAELAAGWTPAQPAPTSAPVPESVSPRQMRRALNAAGLRDTVESAVAAAGRDMQDDWEFALEIRRDWPALKSMTAALGMTEAQVDDLFRAASQIP